jgi:hypothetical protein
VRVTVTDVSSFFGAGFRIAYDPAALLFGGMDSSTSFLGTGITDASQLYFFADATNSPGEVVVTATRVFLPSRSRSRRPDLVVPNFVARRFLWKEVTGSIRDPTHNLVCNGTVVGTGAARSPSHESRRRVGAGKSGDELLPVVLRFLHRCGGHRRRDDLRRDRAAPGAVDASRRPIGCPEEASTGVGGSSSWCA